MKHTAFVIYGNGSFAHFAPTLEHGCEDTKRFAVSSKTAIKSRGVSLVICKHASQAAILEAIQTLENYVTATR